MYTSEDKQSAKTWDKKKKGNIVLVTGTYCSKGLGKSEVKEFCISHTDVLLQLFLIYWNQIYLLSCIQSTNSSTVYYRMGFIKCINAKTGKDKYKTMKHREVQTPQRNCWYHYRKEKMIKRMLVLELLWFNNLQYFLAVTNCS